MKTCPECAEQVQDAAKVCRYCGHRFSGGTAVPATASDSASPRPWIVGGICAVAVIAIVLVLVLSSGSSSSSGFSATAFEKLKVGTGRAATEEQVGPTDNKGAGVWIWEDGEGREYSVVFLNGKVVSKQGP